MLTHQPTKAVIQLKMLISELEKLEPLAVRFDKGYDISGRKLRNGLIEVKKRINAFRDMIQIVRFYRDAWKVYHGQKQYIDKRSAKEKKYGTVTQVAQIQITRKFLA